MLMMTGRQSGTHTEFYFHRAHTEVVDTTMDGSFIPHVVHIGGMP
jgi:hypothetical protein